MNFASYPFPVQYAPMTCVGFDAPIPRCIWRRSGERVVRGNVTWWGCSWRCTHHQALGGSEAVFQTSQRDHHVTLSKNKHMNVNRRLTGKSRLVWSKGWKSNRANPHHLPVPIIRPISWGSLTAGLLTCLTGLSITYKSTRSLGDVFKRTPCGPLTKRPWKPP